MLSVIKYGDYDAILHCYTKETGYESFFLKGLYQNKNKKKALINVLSEISISYSESKNHLPSIKKIDLVQGNFIENNVVGFSMILFIGEILYQILRNENRNEKLYQEILIFLKEVEAKNNNAHLIFLSKLITIQGLAPLDNGQAFLNPETGNFSSKISHPYFTQENSAQWRLLLNEHNYHLPIKKSEKKNLLSSLLIYYHYHQPDFRTPKSLEVLESVFE